MALQIGDEAPDFEAQTTEGSIRFHDWIGDSWAVLFSHPKDFTPICTTELGYMAKIKPEFDKRGVKVIGLSVDSTDDHEGWARDIEETQGAAPNYPIIGDADGYSVERPAKVLALCGLTGAHESDCLYGAARDMTADLSSGQRAAGLCARAPARYRARCFYGIGTIVGSFSASPSRGAEVCTALTRLYATACRRGASA